MRIAVATVHSPFIYGGAEVLHESLAAALEARGHDVEVVAVPWQWSPAERLFDEMLSFRLLDLTASTAGPVDLLLALKFPAYLIPHPNKVVWLFHQHQPAYNLWDDRYGMSQEPNGVAVRDAVRRADRQGLGEARRLFTISGNVSARLHRDLGLTAEALLPPPRNAERFAAEAEEDYLFFPSRITPLKRQALVLEALAETRQPVRVLFSGRPDVDDVLAGLERRAAELGVADRVTWAGWLDDEALISTYARCRGVVFPPLDEDFGFVTAEAMLSSKTVITCRDAGGPLDLVVDGETGWVTEPRPAALAAAMDELWADPELGLQRGAAGRRRYEELRVGWDRIVEELLG